MTTKGKTSSKLPSKKFVIAVLVALAIVVISFFVSQQPPVTKTPISKNDTEELKENDPATKDSDKDGLYDWEENLWGTDANDPDTDGDGISDGEEVAQNRNPLVSGPNDLLYDNSGLILPGSTEEEISEAKKEFYSMFLKEQGDEIREMTVLALMQNFDKEEFINRDEYTLNDLNLSSKNDDEFIRSYGNTLGEIFARYANKQDYPYDEVAIFGEALETKNPSGLAKLEFVSLAYKNLTEDLFAIETPMSAAQNHLPLVNGYGMLSETVGAMRFFFEDPLRGGLAYETYVGQTALNQVAFFNIMLYFENKNIQFDEDEPGSLFNTSL